MNEKSGPDIEVVEFDIPDDKPAGSGSTHTDNSQSKIPHSPPLSDKENNAGAEFVYKPETGLVERVSVCRWKTAYSYYEEFCIAAMKLRDYTADACPCVPFFSYIPQYSQLSQAQMRFYLYMRSEIEEERYPEADYSYILLLIYEIINLSDVNGTEYSLDMLCNILVGYKDSHDRLLLQLSDWLCDFCLINKCVPPREKIEPILPEIIRATEFPEFYICLYGNNMSPESVIRYSASYDYHKSRYAQGQSRALYEKVMNGVIGYIMREGPVSSLFTKAVSMTYTITRDSYVGALCSPKIKKRLIIEFRSIARSHELKLLVSDILKYTENKLRSIGGYKSRLTVGNLPPEVRAAVDTYLSGVLGSTPRQIKDEIPEYEKYYEPAKSELSLESAKAIEEKSWQTTEKLTGAFSDGENTDEECVKTDRIPEQTQLEKTPQNEPDLPENDEKTAENASSDAKNAENPDSLKSALSDAELAFLRAALDENREAQREISKSAKLSVDLIADNINTAAAELFGDVILEDNGECYVVIEDYLEDISKEFES